MKKEDKNINLDKLERKIDKLEKEVQIVKFNMASKDEIKEVKEQMVTKKNFQEMMTLLDKILKNLK